MGTKRLDMGKSKQELFEELKKVKAFWSYSEVNQINDESLIEHVLMRLEVDRIKDLFLLFGKNKVRQAWKEYLVKQEPFFHEKNRHFASVYFGIKNPDKYLSREAAKQRNF